MEVLQFILEDGLIMIPVLYIIAEVIKAMGIVNKKYVPLVLLVISIILSPLILLGGYNASNVAQAILIAGATVFGHEVLEVRKGE